MTQEPSTADIIQMLKERQGTKGLREFAAEIGITASFLCDLYYGRRNPGDKVLKGLGLPPKVKTAKTKH